MSERVEKAIRKIPDFPKKDTDFDYIAAIESRGFFPAAPIAYLMNKGLVIIRKPGKLPAETISAEYDLEYGKDKLEIHVDAIEAGKKVIIMDDLIATGGTLQASIELVQRLGGKVQKAAFLMELKDLNAREKFSNIELVSMLKF